MNWSTAWSLKKTTQNFQVSEMLLYRKSGLKPAQILNRKPFAPSLRQDGQTTKLQYRSLYIHIGLFVTNLPYTKDSYSNKIVSSYLLRFDQTLFTSFMQFTVVSSLPSDTLVPVCSGQGLTAKLKTSARSVLLVHNMPSNILENHLSLTQCLHYSGNWSLRTCLHSTVVPI